MFSVEGDHKTSNSCAFLLEAAGGETFAWRGRVHWCSGCTCASSVCQDSLSGSAAKNETAVIKPGCLRGVGCLCIALGGWVRVEAKQMSWLPMFVCHICQMAFFGKSAAQKSPKQQNVAKMLNFLSPLQETEISRKQKRHADCCLLVILLFSLVYARGSLQAPRWQHQPVAPSGPVWSSPGSWRERCGHARAMLWPVRAEIGLWGWIKGREGVSPCVLRFSCVYCLAVLSWAFAVSL